MNMSSEENKESTTENEEQYPNTKFAFSEETEASNTAQVMVFSDLSQIL
jgi:hypothetical protein